MKISKFGLDYLKIFKYNRVHEGNKNQDPSPDGPKLENMRLSWQDDISIYSDARQENTTWIGGNFLILDNIKRLCREHQTNITSLEKEVGLGFGTVYKWGKVSPSVDNLKLVADYFGVTIDQLMDEKREA